MDGFAFGCGKVCEYVCGWGPRQMLGLFLPHTLCSQDRLHIHYHHEKNKVIAEEQTNIKLTWKTLL